MNEQQNTRVPARKTAENTASSPATAGSPPVSASFTATGAERPRVWLLPAASDEFLAVASESNIRALGEQLREAPPEVLAANVEAGSESAMAARTWKSIEPRFVEQMHESIFDFAKRMMVSVAWLAVSFGAVRVRGEIEDLGLVLGFLGLGFLGYTLVRYGYGVVRWHNRRVDASHAFAQATLKSNPLAARLAAALKLRLTLQADERGKSPDDELLDTNAYRKLIADGTTTSRELTALGEALHATLKFQDDQGEPRKVSDIAKDSGLSVETVMFYRDLSAAAAEIRLTDGVGE